MNSKCLCFLKDAANHSLVSELSSTAVRCRFVPALPNICPSRSLLFSGDRLSTPPSAAGWSTSVCALPKCASADSTPQARKSVSAPAAGDGPPLARPLVVASAETRLGGRRLQPKEAYNWPSALPKMLLRAREWV